jgi:hypothetical protein
LDTGKTIRMGIGFATGRRSFQKVLKTHLYNWRETELAQRIGVRLSLLVAYDLKYSHTKRTDYTNVRPELLDLLEGTYFIGKYTVQREVEQLITEGVLNEKEARLFLSSGYAAQRNAVLYTAMKKQLDYLIFFDDDEYPVAVTNTRSTAIWGGQHVISTHLDYIGQADITHGHHCGYISPIPQIEFNGTLSENDFRIFIEAISNDIINWDSIRAIMDNGGVTYADTKILVGQTVEEVPEVNHTKFISGANLCINLTKPERVMPFYNPPRARGEDTFLSTCLSEHRVLRVPCYTFHDGFATYNHLLDGVLPIRLNYIRADSEKIITRFYNACIGWIRYKPLLLYITQREKYEEKIMMMRAQLMATLPKICAYFHREDFMKVLDELDYYSKNVEKHYREYLETQRIWANIRTYLQGGWDRENQIVNI